MSDVQHKLGMPFPPKLAIGTRVRIEVHGTEHELQVESITVKYTEDKTTVRLAVKESDGQVELGLHQ